MHDRAALILMFGVPLFAFVILTLVFSHPVIRGLGVAIVDEDRSETSRAFVEQVAASPSLGIVERAGDLSTAARAIRAGDAIAAIYIPANFERDLKAARRPQVVAFYNQQYLTAAGVASSGLSDSLSAAVNRAVAPDAPKPSRVGSLVGRNHRAGQSAAELRPVPAARVAADGDPRRRRAHRRLCGRFRVPAAQHAHLARMRRRQSGRRAGRQACAPVRDLLPHHAGGAFVPRGDARGGVQRRPADDHRRRLAADRRLPGARGAASVAGGRSRDRARPDRHRRVAGIRLCGRRVSDLRHERVLADLGRDPAGALVHGRAARAGGARTADP